MTSFSFLQKVLCILWLGTTAAAFATQTNNADSPKEVKKALLQVQHKMQKLEKSVYQSKREEKSLVETLAKLEKEIGNSAENLKVLQQKLASHESTLKNLQQQEKELKESTQKHQAALAELMEATFIHYRKEKLQLLFEQQAWSTLSRQNQYYQYFYNARSAQINHLQNSLQKIQLLQNNINNETKEIQGLTQKLSKDQSSLLEAKEKRQSILDSLSKKLENEQEALSQLQKQEQHLSAIFKTLHDKLDTTPVHIEPHQDFAKAKHSLALPIQGQGIKLTTLPHINKPGAKKSYISAQNGTPVNAIFGGRVVFAEWLRGLGLLIIVDHGNGYMSLYGNNQKLYKGLGEWVNQGEMIATVGQSGGHAEPGLYFEIRKDGEAQDPSQWFIG
ncbi:MAG: peptidoglycan DD-metalloendopeptidase family protein [Proteobacteria bacterium]|nr:peptidoglycan DD-metalloendopeptidase family protein [Pseudomonadota bacterium]